MNGGYWAKTEGRCDNLDCTSNPRGLRRMWFVEKRSDPDRPESAYAIMLCEACFFAAMADAWAELDELPAIAMQPESLTGLVRGRADEERVPLTPEEYKRISAMAMAREGKPLQLQTERKLKRREKTKVQDKKGRAA